jgi:hypothetical protein
MKKIVFWILGIFVAIQLIPIDRTNKPVDKTQNFVDVIKPPKEVAQILKNACYDCHSNEVKYPKYAYVAPYFLVYKTSCKRRKRKSEFFCLDYL